MQRIALALVIMTAMLGLIGWTSRYVWVPDIVSGRITILASAVSPSGHTFQIVQYWNGSDFYTTELEDRGPDGQLHIAQIDWDDNKHWSCAVNLIEAERKVIIRFPSEPEMWEYRWDLGYIVAPHDRKDIPFRLNSKRRTTLTKLPRT